MKKSVFFGAFLMLFGVLLLACHNNSDDYEPPREEEELSIIDQNQMATDSLSSLDARTGELDN